MCCDSIISVILAWLMVCRRQLRIIVIYDFRFIFTALPHDQHVSTLILDGEEDLWYHDENPPLVWWVNGPDTVHIGRVISRVVRRLDVACVFSQLTSTQLV